MKIKQDKLIIAVLQGDDYPDVIKHLNDSGFYATLLNSSGGFLKRRSVTVMVGLEESRLEEALSIFRAHAGGRVETSFQPGGVGMTAIPTRMQKGGAAVFVLGIERSEKY